jgi:uncharacterized protein YbjT (DUF2867 family)
MTKKILVLGATGFTGAPIAKQLLQDGFSIRVLVRNADKARQLFGKDVDLVAGSAEDPATLTQALKGCDGVEISVPWKVERKVAQQVVSILKSQGRQDVPVVYLSGITVIPENRWYAMIDEKARTEELLEQSGLPYTIFKPSWFMDALALFVRDGRATIFGKQKLPYNFVALEDYSRMVSKAFQDDAARNKKIVVNGPESMVMPEALQRYCDAVHPGMIASTMPVWFGKILAGLTRSTEMKDAVEMMAYFEKVQHVAPANGDYGLGQPNLTLNDWLERQK